MENINNERALLMEAVEINKLGRSNLGLGPLCNLTDGGEGNSGKIVSENSRKKMSVRAKERLRNPSNHPFFNKHHSDISKASMSISAKKRFSDPLERKRISEATRKAMYSSGHIDRISKEITMISPEGKVVISKNISQFCRDNNLQNGNLYKVIRGDMKSHRGWTLPKTV